jgi:predicted nucleic acid-binding Zn ribbon protein
MNKRDEVAEWYIMNVYPYVTDKETEIEWLITQLKDNAFTTIEEMYDEQMNNLEADGFFK